MMQGYHSELLINFNERKLFVYDLGRYCGGSILGMFPYSFGLICATNLCYMSYKWFRLLQAHTIHV